MTSCSVVLGASDGTSVLVIDDPGAVESTELDGDDVEEERSVLLCELRTSGSERSSLLPPPQALRSKVTAAAILSAVLRRRRLLAWTMTPPGSPANFDRRQIRGVEGGE